MRRRKKKTFVRSFVRFVDDLMSFAASTVTFSHSAFAIELTATIRWQLLPSLRRHSAAFSVGLCKVERKKNWMENKHRRRQFDETTTKKTEWNWASWKRNQKKLNAIRQRRNGSWMLLVLSLSLHRISKSDKYFSSAEKSEQNETWMEKAEAEDKISKIQVMWHSNRECVCVCVCVVSIADCNGCKTIFVRFLYSRQTQKPNSKV